MKIRKDEKVTISKIARCVLQAKIEDTYYVKCKIYLCGRHTYTYKMSDNFLTLDRDKRLYLVGEALDIVINECEKFENELKILGWTTSKENCRVSIKQVVKDYYDAIMQYYIGDNTFAYKVYRSRRIDYILNPINGPRLSQELHRLVYRSTAETINDNPYYIAARNDNNIDLCEEIKLCFRLANLDECIHLSKMLDRKILPPLPIEYDKQFIVNSEDIDIKLLRDSGYNILHKSSFSMIGHTHDYWILNPYSKNGVDAVKIGLESISFGDYIEMILDYLNIKSD